MIITKDQVKALEPCADGYKWYLNNVVTEDGLQTLVEINGKNPEWAQWLFMALMTVKQRRQLAVFAARQVLHIFEERHPNDDGPRKAIEAAERVIIDDTEENRRSASAASAAASYASSAASASAASASAASASSSSYASYSYASYACSAASSAAASSSSSSCASAYASAYATHAYAYASSAADYAARKEMQERIIHEAVRILESDA